MLEIRVEEDIKLYTCDSAHSANKYLVGGNSGTVYYMVGQKSYEWLETNSFIIIERIKNK